MIRRLLPTALVAGGGIGLIVGLALGAHYPGYGLVLMLLEAVRHEVNGALLGALVLLVVFAACFRLLAPRLPLALATATAAAVAGAPLLAWAGYRLNRALGIRPAQIVSSYALPPNLALMAVGALLWAGLCAAFLRWWRRGGEGRGLPGWRSGVAVVLLAALVNGAVVLAMRTGEPRRPDVFVLLVDALRADHVGAYGYPRATTPALDALAADGVVFRQAVSQSTFTKSSIASLFTGRYPYRHGVYWGSRQETPGTVSSDLLGAGEVTLAEVLVGHGYLTAAWVQNSHLRDFMGFAQGFVDYHDQQGGIERIHRVVERFLAGPAHRYDSFAYLHYIDLHDPYRPEPPYDTLFGPATAVYEGIDLAEWGRFLTTVREGRRELTRAEIEALRNLYDGQLRYIDDQIAELVAALRGEGLYEESLIVVTSDHGDAFGEHGAISHSTAPYEELIRVPLIVKLPGGRFAGREVAEPVRLVDVMPTVLDVVGVSEELPVDGCSLLRLLRGGAQRHPRCSYAVIEIAEEEGVEPTVAVRTGEAKYIHFDGRRDELYDLATDPGERTNLLSGERSPETEQLAERMRRLALDVVAARQESESEHMELDEQTIRELKALGYLD